MSMMPVEYPTQRNVSELVILSDMTQSLRGQYSKCFKSYIFSPNRVTSQIANPHSCRLRATIFFELELKRAILNVEPLLHSQLPSIIAVGKGSKIGIFKSQRRQSQQKINGVNTNKYFAIIIYNFFANQLKMKSIYYFVFLFQMLVCLFV
ncbi:hypothetical protein TTHERM_000652549 (macronuclear) [Tetrahymena thermophila SB210]|uniref:Uncharacterized protein n=1 Tax=Tetrahymena thermophila (strain SB210) TaxID=312017 RepID=W7XIQ8_TETTS|nr:hypothetical protein TTHERM_000652549 [Tetrahymena thermophila SB210]EWS74826.1 hypothetical protein TTHERM_000652549 [Tetrahymena thermophila SB210]|eukprot:XP_012652657.1 hypothetical protein TTHERM_000652549 [Tetrahymena thermophila SB210]